MLYENRAMRRSRAGFTYIEMMIAIGVMLVALGSAMQISLRSAQGVR